MATVYPYGQFQAPPTGLITTSHGHQHHRKGYCRTISQLFHRHTTTFNVLTVPPSNVYPAKFRVCGLKLSFENSGIRRRSSSNCSTDDHNQKNAENYFLKGFSNLSPEFPWDGGSVWSTMATYFFLLHIPLGLGGLSIVAEVLHQDDLDPQTKAISLLFTQTFELLGAISLIQSTGKPISPSKTFKFFSTKIWAERGWLKASAAGLAIIYIVVLLTSAWQEFFETKGMKNIALEELLTSSVTARCTCFIVYCVITPILEEYVYRWFLITSLTLYMEWPLAVIVSSCIFSFGHFSIENAIQIFFIGCVLGSAYTWSGNLASSFVIHCVYNFAILMATI